MAVVRCNRLVRQSRPIRQLPDLAIWGYPPFVPSATVVSPHSGATDMARAMGIAVAGTEGLGQYETGGQADYLTSIQSLAEMYESMSPLIDFLGEHPWAAMGLIMFALVAGGAVGGYIGAGIRAEQMKVKKRK